MSVFGSTIGSGVKNGPVNAATGRLHNPPLILVTNHVIESSQQPTEWPNCDSVILSRLTTILFSQFGGGRCVSKKRFKETSPGNGSGRFWETCPRNVSWRCPWETSLGNVSRKRVPSLWTHPDFSRRDVHRNFNPPTAHSRPPKRNRPR